MVVYADVLICLNTVTTYFTLLAVKAVNRTSFKTVRIVFSSLIGGFSSLYILLPQQSAFVEILIKLILSGIIISTAFGRADFKQLLRGVLIFFGCSFIYAGFMLCVWYTLKPDGMVVNNGVVYFQISPIVLILLTVLCYFLLIFLKRFLHKKDDFSEKVAVTVLYKGERHTVDCMVDSGNTLRDPFGSGKIIVTDKKAAEKIFGSEDVDAVMNFSAEKTCNKNFRIIPYKTVMGEGLLPALRTDGATVNGKTMENVIVGIAESGFDGDAEGIISPDFCL